MPHSLLISHNIKIIYLVKFKNNSKQLLKTSNGLHEDKKNINLFAKTEKSIKCPIPTISVKNCCYEEKNGGPFLVELFKLATC